MGHIRLGVLPKTRRWHEVAELLTNSPDRTEAIVAAVVDAADHRLRLLANDESLIYAFWLLTRIASAARRPSVTSSLLRIGIVTDESQSTLAFISLIADKVRQRTLDETGSGDFSELASLAVRNALIQTVGERGPSLFGSTVEDLYANLRSYSAPGRFGVVAHRFFADFFARTIRSVVDREVTDHIGEGQSLRGLPDAEEIVGAIDLYARQSARITQEFAEGWYSKHDWESHGEITQAQVRGFVAYAVRKLRLELKEGKSPP